MNSQMRWLFASVVGAVVFFGEFGCLLDSSAQNTASAAQEQTGTITPDRLRDFVVPIINDNKVHPNYMPLPVKPPNDSAKEINTILLKSCEREPDEVAVPLNVEKQKSCHKVTAEVVHAGAKDVVYMDADYFWSIDDESILTIVGGKSAREQASIELEALHDIFSEVGLTEEPRTELTVCATPKNGWQDQNHPPLCRSLPVYAVANMEGSWCFSGNTIIPEANSDCRAVYIHQDGRFLTVDTGGNGTIYEKQLDFWYDDLNYRSVESSASEMWGIVAVGEDMLGTFSAFRLPL